MSSGVGSAMKLMISVDDVKKAVQKELAKEEKML